MAVPLLAKEKPKEYVELLEERARSGRRLSDLERERFGYTHAEVAGAMARSWKMPEEFARILEVHSQLEELVAKQTTEVGQLAVALSSYLPSCSDTTWNEQQMFERFFNQINAKNGPTIAEILAQVDKDYIEFAPVLKLAAPKKTLVQSYEEMFQSA